MMDASDNKKAAMSSWNIRPLLSLCIPTYNRASVLDIALKNIVSQKGFDHRLEVVVIDNNSSDNTEEIVEEYHKNYPNVIYHKNDVNIGMEKNFIRALQCGNGQLLKLWNDYCLFSDNKLEEILTLIEQQSNEQAILFFYNKPGDSEVYKCGSLDCFFRRVTYWPTWIGTFSIWKTDFDAFKSVNDFEGLLFPHLLMFLENFKTKKIVNIIYGVTFQEVKGIKKGGYDFFEIFIKNFVGKIMHGLYKEKRINFKTLYIVKSSFLKKFATPWVARIFLEKTHSFKKSNAGLLLKYFRYYPGLLYMATYLIFARLKKRSTM